jgi:ribosomal protein L1
MKPNLNVHGHIASVVHGANSIHVVVDVGWMGATLSTIWTRKLGPGTVQPNPKSVTVVVNLKHRVEELQSRITMGV